jgi:hypothetical protein
MDLLQQCVSAQMAWHAMSQRRVDARAGKNRGL